MALFSLFLQVADQEVIYRDISIEGPNGIIRTSPPEDIDGTTPTPVGTCTIDTATVRTVYRASSAVLSGFY